MSTDVFTTFSQEHETLLPLILDIQSAAEAADILALVKKFIAGRQALTCAGYLGHPCRKEGGQVTSSAAAPEGEPYV
jgi:hypothetical protein